MAALDVRNDSARWLVMWLEPLGEDRWLRPGECFRVRSDYDGDDATFSVSFWIDDSCLGHVIENVNVWVENGNPYAEVTDTTGTVIECGHQRPEIMGRKWKSMRVTVEKVTRFSGPYLAQIQTPIGRTAVAWEGDADAVPGEYHVEWRVTQPLMWGVNVRQANEQRMSVGPGGHCVVMSGVLFTIPGQTATFHMGGATIPVEFEVPPPAEPKSRYVELFLALEDIKLVPVDVVNGLLL